MIRVLIVKQRDAAGVGALFMGVVGVSDQRFAEPRPRAASELEVVALLELSARLEEAAENVKVDLWVWSPPSPKNSSTVDSL